MKGGKRCSAGWCAIRLGKPAVPLNLRLGPSGRVLENNSQAERHAGKERGFEHVLQAVMDWLPRILAFFGNTGRVHVEPEKVGVHGRRAGRQDLHADQRRPSSSLRVRRETERQCTIVAVFVE